MVVFCCRRCTRLSLTRRRRRRRRRGRSRSRRQILLLYKRFRTLDKGKRGYLQSSDLTGSIPELSINPLNKRVAYFYDGINFKEFVRILAPYSPKASPNDKIKALFAVWDVNGDGRVCKEDVAMVLREACGTNMMEAEVARVVARVFEAGGKQRGRRVGEVGVSGVEFVAVLGGTDIGLGVDFSTI